MGKTYHVTDLFKTSWQELTTEEIAHVIDNRDKMLHARANNMHGAGGHYSIMLLRTIRKNKSLVAQITVEQAVDIVNDIDFYNKPWYFFPEVGGYKPDDLLKNHTFIQLFYIDSLFSMYHIQDYNDRHAHPTLHPSAMSQAYLDEMIGVIYTLPSQFDEAQVKQRGEQIGKILTNDQRFVIMHAYANVKEFIINNCPNLFPIPEDDQPAIVEKRPVESEPMWKQLLFDLSETLAYQGMINAKRAPMYEALDYLEKKHKDFNQTKKNKHAQV
jgi:hypothetical protein